MKKIYLALLMLVSFATLTKAQIGSYTFATTSGTYTSIVGAPGTVAVTLGNLDDAISASQTIPFTFNFGGTNFTTYSINSNGWINLGALSTSTTNYSSLSGTDNNVIAAFNRDLDGNNTTATTYYVQTTGTSPNQITKIEYVNIKSWSGTVNPQTGNFQIWLYQGSNVVEMHYGAFTTAAARTTAATCQVGLRGASTGAADVSSLNNTGAWSTPTFGHSSTSSCALGTFAAPLLPDNGRIYTFTPPTPCAGTPTPGNTISSSPSACTGNSVTLSLQNSTSGSGVNYQWYSSPDGVIYTPIAGATSSTYVAVITANTYFKADVTCTAGPATGTSNPIQVLLNTTCSYNTGYTTGVTYNSISATGSSATYQGTSGDDNTTTDITLPFPFTFKGTSYTVVNACTNGWMSFGSTASISYTNTLSSTANGSPALLAPFWDDLVVTGQATASLPTSFKYQTLGTAPNRVFVAEWIGMETFGNPGPNLNFQVKLYEGTNRIEYVYGTMEGYNGTGSAVLYSYSLGLRASATDYISLQKDNTNFFSTAIANDALNVVPACNSMYSFVPSAVFTTGTDPGTVLPVNDDPAGAITVPVNGAPCSSYCGTYYKTANATASAGIATCGAVTPGTPDDDVWFKFTATNAAQNISVFGGGGYDAVVQAFSDAGLTSIGCVNATGAGATETLALTGLTVGNTYYIRVYHAAIGNGTTPQISICISAPPVPPSNDDPCGAVILTPSTTCTPYSDNSANSTTSVTTATTTTQSSTGNAIAAPTCTGAGASVNDVWFKFTATGDRHGITITPVPGFDVAVEAFTPTGTCAGSNLALTSIGCVNGASTGIAENVVISTTIGNVYYLRVYRHPSGIAGAPVNNSQFSICITSPIPLCSTNVTPADLSTGVSTTPTLTFNRVNYASSYDVYLGTSVGSATLQGNVVDPGVGTTASFNVVTPLSPSTQYFWYVTPKNSNGPAVGCSGTNATSFTTSNVIPPGCVTNITPANGATNVVNPVVFTWNADAAATSYDLYIGTSVATATLNTNVAGTTATVPLTAGTTYFWYVVPKNAGGSGTGCSTNATSFTTSAVCLPSTTSGGTGGDALTDFVLNGESPTAISVTGAAPIATPGYIDLTAITTVDLAQGKAYSGNFKVQDGSDDLTIWIDLNNNGGFEANERVLNNLVPLAANATTPFSIMIPASASLGVHKMRVRDVYYFGGTTVPTDQCASYAFGESKDFSVNIVASGAAYTVSTASSNACTAAAATAFTTIDAGSNNTSVNVPLLDASGAILATINANSNNLGKITPALYINTGAVRRVGAAGQYYLNRNIAITPATQPASGNVLVRLFYTAGDLTTLQGVDPSVTSPAALNATKVTGGCAAAFSGTGTFLPQVSSGTYYLDVNTPSFSDFFIAGGNAALPVAIEFFRGSKLAGANYLDWKVNCTSAPSVTLVLERSADGRTFSSIQNQNASNLRCQQGFNYTDVAPLDGINYYRLKIITPDGTFKYSSIVALINGTKGFELISVSPNPVQNTTVLSVTSVKGGKLDISVSDVTGKTVMTKSVTVIAGNTALDLNFSNLGAGTYQISAVNADGERKTTRFVKY